MILPITTLATIALTGLFIVLTIRVVQARGVAGVSLGDGGDVRLTRTIRGQANFVENVPIALLLILLTEMQTVSLWPNVFGWIFALTVAVFVIGRTLHGIAFGFTMNWPFGRMVGMSLSVFSMALLLALAIFAVLV